MNTDFIRFAAEYLAEKTRDEIRAFAVDFYGLSVGDDHRQQVRSIIPIHEGCAGAPSVVPTFDAFERPAVSTGSPAG